MSDVEEVLSHIDEANLYARYIKDENLPPLLTPPYRDLGALLIAVAIYFVALETLQQQSNEQLYTSILQTDIESISYTLLNIATRLGMWHLKHAIEDLSEQILNPERYNDAKQEHKRILQQDALLLEDTRQLLLTTYQEATQQSIVVHYTTCSITGMKRREQDAHTTVTSQKTEFRGFDLVTFDIIVSTIQECYAALGILSHLGKSRTVLRT